MHEASIALQDQECSAEQVWQVGLCACCLTELDPRAVGRAHAAFCSAFCKRRSADVRYDRRALRDNRIVEDLLAGDRMTALVVYRQHIAFYALDLAYVRPRITGAVRQDVLDANGGLCVACNQEPATDVDHIADANNERSNLQGLCRWCHETKPRGQVPVDLTRAGDGTVDEIDYTDLLIAWGSALFSAEPYRCGHLEPSWQHVRDVATDMAHTRFGRLTLQILDDDVEIPAYREDWRDRVHAYNHATRTWAADLTGKSRPAPSTSRQSIDGPTAPKPHPLMRQPYVPEPTSSEVRAWAIAQGIAVARTGRLPQHVVDAYRSAQKDL